MPDRSIDSFVQEILSNRKYRALNLPEETVRDLLEKELAAGKTSPKEALKMVKHRLHNIVALYLGDPDYDAAAAEFTAAFKQESSEPSAAAEFTAAFEREPGERPAAVQAVCQQMLAAHASTLERLPVLEEFYTRIFAVTGTPDTILDLACGLNPFAWPWMGLPASTRYHAYDIHRPRVDCINHYFALQGLEPLAEARDILVAPPEIEADVAFFFKEAHRFEQRRRGACRPFWEALNVRWLLISLPSSSLTGRHDLADQHRRLVYSAIAGLPWQVTELLVGNEMVFCVKKSDR
jgi:16S rRNA (guanine(1405)-N(7))-methyltransferase